MRVLKVDSMLLKNQPPELLIKKGVLKNFAKFTEKHLCLHLFFNKVADLRCQACNFVKNETPIQVLSRELCEVF